MFHLVCLSIFGYQSVIEELEKINKMVESLQTESKYFEALVALDRRSEGRVVQALNHVSKGDPIDTLPFLWTTSGSFNAINRLCADPKFDVDKVIKIYTKAAKEAYAQARRDAEVLAQTTAQEVERQTKERFRQESYDRDLRIKYPEIFPLDRFGVYRIDEQGDHRTLNIFMVLGKEDDDDSTSFPVHPKMLRAYRHYNWRDEEKRFKKELSEGDIDILLGCIQDLIPGEGDKIALTFCDSNMRDIGTANAQNIHLLLKRLGDKLCGFSLKNSECPPDILAIVLKGLPDKLAVLELDYCSLGGNGEGNIIGKALGKLGNLEQLNLSNNYLKGCDLQAIANGLNVGRLQVLNLSGCSAYKDTPDFVDTPAQIKYWAGLSIWSDELQSGLEELAKKFQGPNPFPLEVLDLSHTPFPHIYDKPEDDFSKRGGVLKAWISANIPKLRVLKLTNSGIDARSARIGLVPLLPHVPNLQVLNLLNNPLNIGRDGHKFTNHGAITLVNHLAPGISSLGLGSCGIDPITARVVAPKLAEMRSLLYLDLSSNPLVHARPESGGGSESSSEQDIPTGAIYFIEHLPPSLQRLNLAFGTIDDKAVQFIIDRLQSLPPSIQCLDLRFNRRISPPMLRHLSSLRDTRILFDPPPPQ